MEFKVKKLKNGESLYPYWGKSFDKITGLDPLGQQNASERIYSHLLPGITNLTNRIRYYGFYCWILWKYEELNKDRFNQKEHRIFIRRAEFTAALVMNQMNDSVSQIPGSNKANEVLNSENIDEPIEISKYADHNKEGAYWKYATGALGQYYITSLRTMGLVKEVVADGKLFYVVTQEGKYQVTGKKLAQAFQENLSESSIEKFLNVLATGIIKPNDIQDIFSSFNLANVPVNSQEWNIYWSLLNGPNEPDPEKGQVYFRKKTIDLLLDSSLSDGVQSMEFLDSMVVWGITRDHEDFGTKFGWYLYRLNEYWQLSCGAMFWSILNILSAERNGIYDKNKLVEEVTARICSELKIDKETSVNQLKMKLDVKTVRDLYEKVASGVKANNSWAVLGSAFQILRMLLNLNAESISSYSKIVSSKGLNKKGSFLNFASRFYGEKKFNQSIDQFLFEFIDREILLRHRMVALSKLGSGSRSTLKFDLEEGRIMYDSNFEPSFTNPRIDTLLRILSDMSILELRDDRYHRNTEFNIPV